jgi:hypothetical protein
MTSKKDAFKKRAAEVALIHNTPKPMGGFNDVERIKKSITIVEELQDLIRPLSEEQLTQLEKNLLEHGCQDALILWETTATELGKDTDDDAIIYVLIDGHNRYQLCQKNKIEFKISLKLFSSLEKVKEFMIDLQLGRRNITPEEESYLRGLKYNALKTNRGIVLQNNEAEDAQKNSPVNVAEKLATAFNVSVRTIKNDGKFATGINKLSKELQEEILSGKKSISKKDIQLLADRNDLDAGSIDDKALLMEVKPKESTQNLRSEIQTLARNLKNQLDCDVLIEKVALLKQGL